ncbi:NAD(P)/FAD-dependent oxidoreductase [Mucilaginibacter sp. SG564]|uniref:NAD(P)/FAD-dependent oxidoreductase n=1 Tax=Mucilaginibacter sp. SG564 TaxID=2587022 RepID=UPI001554ED20|nr:NAD(P)/FAD-dependent oxidoreductase [Mucilaginibacter sp. SG564]NOW98515.1 thioredoxin reductase [Mucilaginibacter sp. SG564]
MNSIETDFEVIIIGGSYAGLSAATSLGRTLRKVLVIDSGKPCNQQTPHSHNFLTRDGETPAAITQIALEQLMMYDTVKLIADTAIEATIKEVGFRIQTSWGKRYLAEKLLFATGVKDTMPDIPGFAECWGISVIHCPYCHGYEVRQQATGILGNGDIAYEYAKLINNWTKDITLFTNGVSTLGMEQVIQLRARNINIEETRIREIVHENGRLKGIALENDELYHLNALYNRPAFVQHCDLPIKLGCDLTDAGYINVDSFGRTNISGVYAAGDNTTPMRAVSMSVALGAAVGAFINKDLIDNSYI